MTTKRISRNIRMHAEHFDVLTWSQEHREYVAGIGSVTVSAPPKEQVTLMRNLLDQLRSESELWVNSQTEPRIYGDEPTLVVWRLLLGLKYTPLGVALFQNNLYGITEFYSDSEFRLLVLQSSDRERVKFEQLRAKYDREFARSLKDPRIRILEEVRIAVWRRDQGACAHCGSRERLEYDHIIPISKGGSNTVRNIELLCERCNRSKSDNIQ